MALALAVARPAAAQQWSVDRPIGSPEVVERYREILEANPTSQHGLDGLLREYGPRGGLPVLIEEYSLRVGEAPMDAGLHVILARLRARAGQAEAAVGLLDRAIQLGADGQAVFLLRGQLRGQLGDLEGALADHEAALARTHSADERVDILRALGDLQLSLGYTDLALESYSRIAETAPRDRYIRQELAQILYEAGFRQEALRRYQEVVELAGTNTRLRAEALREVATLQEELGAFPDAIESWRRILRITRDGNWLYREAQEGLVRAHRSWGRLDLLLAELESRTGPRTRDLFVLANRARILAELGRTEEAVAAYRLAIDRRPEERPLYKELASLLFEERDYRALETLVDAALERWPDDFELIDQLAESYLAQGLVFDASHLLRSHEEQFWTDRSALWRFFERYHEIGDSAAADRVADRLLALDPSDARPLFAQARAFLEAGRQEEAMHILNPLLQSDDNQVILDLIDLFREQSFDGAARELLDDARRRFPDDDRIALAWLRVHRSDDLGESLDAARQVLLLADDWDVVQEAFDYYLGLLEEAGLVEWAVGFYGERYDRDPTDYRTGRTLLMFQVVSGDGPGAARTLTLIRATAPRRFNPDQWVLSTLREWPSPSALPLLRRLGDADPAGRWRYEVIGAQLLIEGGRYQDARSALEIVYEQHAELPAAVFAIAEVFLEFQTQPERDTGCWMMANVVEAQPRNPTYRVGFVDCLAEVGKTGLAYRVSLEGFETVREPGVADILFDRMVRSLPPDVSRTQVEEALRASLTGGNAQMQRWLEARLAEW